MPVPMPGPAESLGENETRSGRMVVTSAVLTVLVLWLALYLVFRQWRSRYRERAAFGERYVAAAIDPLASIVPAGELPEDGRAVGCAGVSALSAAVPSLDVSPDAWRQAIEETRAMLVTVTAANVLDLSQMRALQAEVTSHVTRARPETARASLAEIWNDLEAKAAPIIQARHPRPALLPRRPEH